MKIWPKSNEVVLLTLYFGRGLLNNCHLCNPESSGEVWCGAVGIAAFITLQNEPSVKKVSRNIPLMMDLREINTTRPQNNQQVYNRNASEVRAQMIKFLYLLKSDWRRVPPARVWSPLSTFHSMTQICQFIFSGPFVKWDLYSTTRCSHKRHYGSITS